MITRHHRSLASALLRGLVVVALLASQRAASADRATAERYFRAGARAYAAQDFAAAASDFDEAFKADAMPEIAFSGAQAYRRLYRVDPKPEYVKRAVELYRIYLEHVKTGGRVGDAADSLGEMQRELDRLKLSATPTATPQAERTRLGVNVTITDQGHTDSALHEIGDITGEVTKGLAAKIDGKPLAPFALVDVEAKEHVLSVTADGYLPVEKKVMAVTGQSQLIEIELRPKPATLTVTTEGDADIAVDGRGVATAPAHAIELPAGKHLLTVTHRGREPFGRELVLARGQALTVSAPLEKTGRRRVLPWVWGGATVLAAGAVATGIVALERDSHASDLRAEITAGNRAPSDADAYDRAVESRDHYVTATWALGGAAVVLGTTGLLLYLYDRPSTESLRVTPMAGPGVGGATLSGRW